MILVHSSVQDLHLLYRCVHNNIFSVGPASPPPTIGQNDTGTQLSPGFTFAIQVCAQQQQTCDITMSIHNNVNKATSLGGITKHA